MDVPKKVGTAVVAWALLLLYALLFIDVVNTTWSTHPPATVDPGLKGLIAILGGGVLGVIAGLFGVEAPSGNALTQTPSRIGRALVPAPKMDVKWANVAGIFYIVAYIGILIFALAAWEEKGSHIAPDILQSQVLAGVGLLVACGVVRNSTD